MKRKMPIVPLLVVLLAVGAWVAVQGRQPGGPIYSPAAVRAGLAHNPTAWVGRTVLVRGMLIDMHQLFASISYAVLMPPMPVQSRPGLPGAEAVRQLIEFTSVVTGSQVLLLRTVPPNSFAAFLRRVPLVGQLFLPAQQSNALSSAVYRVHLLPPGQDCVQFAQRGCFDAVLVDYQPGTGPFGLRPGWMPRGYSVP